MMLKHRIIPVLLWDGRTAVQTTKFTNIRPVGSMEQHIEVMESRNIDELIILDIAATKEKREPNFELIKRYAGKLFCPVTYGGGISISDHAVQLIQECGVDKVSICNMCLSAPHVINYLATKLGSQAIIGAINSREIDWINWVCGSDGNLLDGGGFSAWSYAQELEKLGCGEILLTDVYQNGTMCGYNHSVIREVSQQVKIPIIANGGCDTHVSMQSAFEAGASACAASSMFLFTEHTPRSCARALQEAGVAVRVDG